MHNSKFDYGNSVLVKLDAPKKFLPGEGGSVCGKSILTTESEAIEFSCPINEWVYTIEFADGSSVEIAESHLEPDPNCLKYCLNDQVLLLDNIADKYHPNENVAIINYHIIDDLSLANQFNLIFGDAVYVVKAKNGDEFLIPEAFIKNIQKY